MRETSTRAVDIAVVVVAADDGVMPQTVEAVDPRCGAQIVVAVTKSEVLDLRADADAPAEGVVVDTVVDARHGGTCCDVLVTWGGSASATSSSSAGTTAGQAPRLRRRRRRPGAQGKKKGKKHARAAGPRTLPRRRVVSGGAAGGAAAARSTAADERTARSVAAAAAACDAKVAEVAAAREIRRRLRPFCGRSDADKESSGPVVPIFALPLVSLRAVGRLAPMEAAGKARAVHVGAGSLIYVSHEWGGRDEPDPTGEQFEVLAASLEACDGGAPSRLRECVLDPRGCYLWLDYWSAPQSDPVAKLRAARNVPVFVGAADAVVLLARTGPGAACVFVLDGGPARRSDGDDAGGAYASPLVSPELSPRGASSSPARRWAAAELVAQILREHVDARCVALRAEGDLEGFRTLAARRWALFDGAAATSQALGLHDFLEASLFASAFDVGDAGDTPLHYAALRDDALLVDALLDAGAPVDARDARGRSALGAAVQGSAGAALLARGAAAGASPVAACRLPPGPRSVALATLLLDRGADPTPALKIAAAKGNAELCALLERRGGVVG
ncbi:hypothetical protein JL720_1472 [Aureococcus anophagefferens]|nr:hypothetical protein JL720_1472 [Aureococcus anophagefferens]